ncbi:MAG: pyruvate, phosphate dikinase, partial [Deltaproteobacteria bacterium]|nr:pyruvate, phosphate dikinase [Deltaproteobacteria bacterium]
MKKVWASAWKLTAYDARADAGIDQSQVQAGALIQTAVAATAAGVLVTRHPTDPTDARHYTINAKHGLGLAVVDGKKIPESLIVNWYNHGIRVLSRSDEETRLVYDPRGGTRELPNPHKGAPVLTSPMAIRLADTARALTKLFENDRLDIEWVYEGDELNIVQARPLVG